MPWVMLNREILVRFKGKEFWDRVNQNTNSKPMTNGKVKRRNISMDKQRNPGRVKIKNTGSRGK